MYRNCGDIGYVCRKYHISRTSLWRWTKKYDGTIELFNGNIVKVASCEDDNSVISRKINVKTGKDQIETIELRFRKVCICFNKQGKVEHLNVTILDNFLEK